MFPPAIRRTVQSLLLLALVAALLAACVPISSTAGDAAADAAPADAPAGAPAGGPPAGVPPGGPAGAGMASFSATPAFADLTYADVSPTQTLDIYLPEGDGPFPTVINYHAGGFKFGDKGMIPDAAGAALLDAGYALVGVNYRLSEEATFPAPVQDAMAAVRFLRANAATYNLDPERFVAFGQSAGGNLAAMVGTASDVAAFNDPALGNTDVSSAVQAVINWFGPTDFGLMDEQAAAQGCAAADQTHGDAASFESAYLGAPVGESPELVQQANPITYITPDDPPTLIQKGDQDCTVPVAQSQILADAYAAAGLPVQYDVLAGAAHGDTGGTPIFESPENVQAVVDWIGANLP